MGSEEIRKKHQVRRSSPLFVVGLSRRVFEAGGVHAVALRRKLRESLVVPGSLRTGSEEYVILECCLHVQKVFLAPFLFFSTVIAPFTSSILWTKLRSNGTS